MKQIGDILHPASVLLRMRPTPMTERFLSRAKPWVRLRPHLCIQAPQHFFAALLQICEEWSAVHGHPVLQAAQSSLARTGQQGAAAAVSACNLGAVVLPIGPEKLQVLHVILVLDQAEVVKYRMPSSAIQTCMPKAVMPPWDVAQHPLFRGCVCA